jgi:5-methylcytosine-specific restriction enzyme subunit McrC
VGIVLREHERFSPKDHGVDLRAYERLRRFDLRRRAPEGGVFTWYARHAKASQWVGVVQVEGLQVEILPKIETQTDEAAGRLNLLAMLAIAGDLPVRSRELASLADRKASLSDLLARLFAERLVEELLKGPDRRYVRRHANLHAFKGKLAVHRQLLRNAAHRERFACDFDELLIDTPLNGVFRAACRLLLRQTKSAKSANPLRRALLLLDEVSDVEVTAQLLDGIALDRKTERFDSVLHFCRMLFAGRSPTARAGESRTFSLLFDMNVVFERFVTSFVLRFVLPRLPGWTLFPQAHRRHRYLLERHGRGVLRLAPDLLLEDPEGHLLVLDTKWKTLSRRGKQDRASRSDLYQLYAYAQRFGSDRSILLYPQAPGLTPDWLTLRGHDRSTSAKRIEVHFCDVGTDLASRSGRDELAAALTDLILDGSGSRAHPARLNSS